MTWKIPQTAPTDGTPFIGIIAGYPWPVVCMWCAADQKWVYATPECGLYQGKWNDWCFINEQVERHELAAWMDMPDMPIGRVGTTHHAKPNA